MATARPNLIQYLGYSYGRRLPDSMREWVANDLAGYGAVRRHMIRMVIPPLFVLAPLWLLPASFSTDLGVHYSVWPPRQAPPCWSRDRSAWDCRFSPAPPGAPLK